MALHFSRKALIAGTCLLLAGGGGAFLGLGLLFDSSSAASTESSLDEEAGPAGPLLAANGDPDKQTAAPGGATPSVDPGPSASHSVGDAPAGEFLMAKVPMQLGFYVAEMEECRTAYFFHKFEEEALWNISEDEEGILKEGGRLSQVTGPSEEFYRLGWDEDRALYVKPLSPTVIEVAGAPIGDFANRYKLCEESDIPALFRG